MLRRVADAGRALFGDQLVAKIARNSGIILTGNLASSALGFVSFAIVASRLGPELLAYFALAQVYALIVNDLFNVQTWESLIKFGAKNDENFEIGRTVKTNVLIDIGSAFFAFVFAVVFVGKIGAALSWDGELIELALLYSLIIPFTLTTLTVGVPRLYDKFSVIAKVQFGMAVLKLALVAFVSYKQAGVFEYTAVYVLVDILINISLIIVSLRLVRKHKLLDWIRTKVRLTREEFRFLWWTNLRTVVRIPVRQLDLIIISQVLSMNVVGIYKAYKEIVGIIGRLADPINQALYPEYAKLLGKDRTVDSISVTRKIMWMLFLASVVTLVGYLIFSKFAIARFLGEEYLAYMDAYYWLVLLFCINLFLTPVHSLFIAAGFAKYSFFIVLGNNILYLIVALVGGIYYGIYGMIMAYAAQMAFNQGLKVYYLKKHSTGWGTVIR